MRHLCLVSAQPTPNLAPALNDGLRPEKVILAVSPQMSAQAAHQKAVLERFHVPVEILPLPDAYDMRSLLNVFCDFLDKHDGQDVHLNATGGTKPMAIAAQEAFRMAGLPVFYVHDRDAKVIWLDKDKPASNISARMKMEPFLQAHGYAIKSDGLPSGVSKEWKALAHEMACYEGKDKNAVTSMNAIAATAENNQLTGPLKYEAKDAFDSLLSKMYAADVVKYYDDKKVAFHSEDARFFANGGWLEAYLHGCLSQINEFQDFKVNMTVTTDKGTKNEIDGAVLHRNRLTLIECKTRSFKQDSDEDIKVALYKLDSLASLGGLKTSGIFVSYFPVNDYISKRAGELDIAVCHGPNVKRLAEFVKEKVFSS